MSTDSRTAPKFVVRLASPEQRDKMAVAAKDQHIAVNSFICQAIDEKLARGEVLEFVLDMAAQHLEVLKKVTGSNEAQ